MDDGYMKDIEKWLRMADGIARKSGERVWIPIWGYVKEKYVGADVPRRYDECRIFNSLLVPFENKKEAMRMDMIHWNPMTDRYAVIGTDPYFPARAERNGPDCMLGTYLVVKSCYLEEGDYAVSIDQDLLLDLRLKQEGDKWVRPCEGYREVIRLSRNAEGRINLVEIKSEYLKDWLCVRKQGLVLLCHVERKHLSRNGCEIFAKPEKKRIDGGCWEAWNYGCDEYGNGILGDVHVMTCGYSDVNGEEDVPVFDFSHSNREMCSSEHVIHAPKITTRMDMAQFTRAEWLPSGKTQQRMPFDHDGALPFICEADGRTKKGKALSFPGRYLWFNNGVLKQIAGLRGGRVRWLTRETGLVGVDDRRRIHFGVNRIGLVNVFAKDIVETVWWMQAIWKAHNVCPDGGVCEELMDAQQRCQPANTHAPENLLHYAFEHVAQAYAILTHGDQLFNPFESINEVGNSIQRFNVQTVGDIYWLAKQMTRLFIESLNQDSLRKIANVARGDNLKSLKLLERVLSGVTDKNRAYSLLSPLHAIYALRNADSHIPGHDIGEAMKMLQISPSVPLIQQGEKMIFVAAKTLHEIAIAFQKTTESDPGKITKGAINGK